MLKKLSVLFCGAAVTLMTAGSAAAQSTTQEAKDKTKAAAQKTGDTVTDAGITAAVKTKLLADTKVGGLKIDVDTNNGVVTLTGPVRTAAERTEALRLARTTTGVKNVVNKLVVETAATTGRDPSKADIKEEAKQKADRAGAKAAGAGEATTDAGITSAVKTKLLGDPKVGGLKIDVDTKNNVVTLTGEVRTAAEKNEALRLARTTKGVTRVVDKLTIVPKS
jgi:hyperosmotically inducible periplasmic protein